MKYLLILPFIIFSSHGYSFTPELISKKIKTYSIKVSKNCRNKCQAMKAVEILNKNHIKKIKDDVYGGKTFGNIICRKIFKAKVKYYRDNKKNEQHFCLFKDGSYIPVGEFDYIESELTAK